MGPVQVKLWAYQQENKELSDPFCNTIIVRNIDIENFSGKNFLLINPLSPIVRGLYFSNLVHRVLSYLSIRSERGRRENLGTRLGWVGENPGG